MFPFCQIRKMNLGEAKEVSQEPAKVNRTRIFIPICLTTELLIPLAPRGLVP